ncbi:hypothetical protein SEVIR_6G033900v4 [Setaria viridis]|uniref:Uncharacterized protein n=2 Tax=Setaria TaxID=4554 RepID=A0A368RHP4_SETIT|nr:hypothetical protein SETIT_6G035800v2 [Setaria italica]TKW08596.1 hypothetical protein SEVIR_6G033900v2 [Setaria viridis]
MDQFVGRITMEVAPSKLPSIIRRARLPKILDTIMEDEREALESPRAPSHNAIRTKEVIDTPMYCADKLAFLAPMVKTECLKIKA